MRSTPRESRTLLRATLAVILIVSTAEIAALAQASSGCGGSSAPSDGNRSVSVPGYGSRVYNLDKPTGYSDNTPYPVLIAYHPLGVQTPAQWVGFPIPGVTTWGDLFCSSWYGNFAQAIGSEGILVCPEGLPSSDGVQDWQHSSDIDFFDAMLADLKADLCLDESKVFVAGHSAGAFQTTKLACARGSDIRAIGPVSGGGPASCTQDGQVAAIVLHTAPDSIVQPSWSEDSRDYFAGENGCNLSSSITVPTPNCRRSGSSDIHVTYEGCNDDSYPVEYCRWDNIGHTGMWNIPGQDSDLAAPAVWDFFMSLGDPVDPPVAIFSDGFESGLAAWSASSGSIAASAASARSGSLGGEVPVGTVCGAPETIVFPPPENPEGSYVACDSITTTSGEAVEIGQDGAVFEAGSLLSFGNGFRVPGTADFTAALNSSYSPWSFVTDTSPDSVSAYIATFWLNLNNLSIASGDLIHHFVGSSDNGTVQFRVSLKRNGAERRLALSGRNDNGTYAVAAELAIPAGWNEIRVEWAAGSGDGFVSAEINGLLFTSVESLGNSAARIGTVEWGAVSGTSDASSGRIDIDDFASWQ